MQEIQGFIVEEHFFPTISIAANPKYKKPTNGTLDIEIESGLTVHNIESKPGRLFLDLNVKMAGDPITTPYAIDVVCACFVNTQLDTTDPETKNKASRLGYKILYPAIRELILTLTGRQPWGPFSIGIDIEDEIPPAIESKPKRSRKKNAEIV